MRAICFALCFVLVLAACSGSDGAISPPQRTEARNGDRWPATSEARYLFVAFYDRNEVNVFVPGAATPAETLHDLYHPTSLAVDSNGTLAVATGPGTRRPPLVSLFKAGTTKPYATIPLDSQFDHPQLLFDSRDNLYVGWPYTAHRLEEYILGSAAPIRSIDVFFLFRDMASSASGDVAVADYTRVRVFPPNSTSPKTVIDNVSSSSLLFDKNGYLALVAGKKVLIYAPGSDRPTAELSKGLSSPGALAVDSSNRLYVSNIYYEGGVLKTSVLVFDDAATSPIRTITEGLYGTKKLAVVGDGILCAYNFGSVTEYQPNGTKPIATISGAISDIAVGP